MASFSNIRPQPSGIQLYSHEISTGRIAVKPYKYNNVTISKSGKGRRRSSALRAVQAGGGGNEDGTSMSPSSGDVPAPAAANNGGFSLFNLPPWRMKMAEETLEKNLEGVTEAVEKVAEKTDKVAEDLAASLPEGQLKNVVLKIEKIAEKVDQKAEAAHELIEKVDEFTDKIEENVGKDILVKNESNGDLKSKA